MIPSSLAIINSSTKMYAEAEDILVSKSLYGFSATKLNVAALRREAESTDIFYKKIQTFDELFDLELVTALTLFKNKNSKLADLLHHNISIRDGNTLQCTKRTPIKEGGNIYEYTLINDYFFSSKTDSNYQKYNEMQNAIFPAVEPDWEETQLEFQSHSLAQQLGFNTKEIGHQKCFYAPDAEALKNLWKKLQNSSRPDLPPINVLNLTGIANDEVYGLGTITHDLILSKGRESVHDAFTHALSFVGLFEMRLDENSKIKYFKRNHENRLELLSLYRRLEIGRNLLTNRPLCEKLKVKEKDLANLANNIDKLKIVFGYAADLFDLLTLRSFNSSEDLFDILYREIWNKEHFSYYVQKKFNISFQDKEKKQAITSTWRILRNAQFFLDCLSHIKAPKNNKKILIFSHSRKENLKFFKRFLKAFPSEDATHVAYQLCSLQQRKKFYYRIIDDIGNTKLNSKSFNRLLIYYLWEENNLFYLLVDKLLVLFNDEDLFKLLKITYFLLQKFHQLEIKKILKALRKHQMTIYEIKTFSQEFVKNIQNHIEYKVKSKEKLSLYYYKSLIGLLKVHDPYKVSNSLYLFQNSVGDFLNWCRQLNAYCKATKAEVSEKI